MSGRRDHHPDVSTGLRRHATFDPSGRYRYLLVRTWDASLARLVMCMLNPSTADAARDDPTIRRCIGLARGWGFGALEVVNLFAFCTSDPGRLQRCRSPIGARNDWYIAEAAGRADVVVVGWGNAVTAMRRIHQARAGVVLELLGARSRVMCLGTTRMGQPRHPLYIGRGAALEDFRPLSNSVTTIGVMTVFTG